MAVKDKTEEAAGAEEVARLSAALGKAEREIERLKGVKPVDRAIVHDLNNMLHAIMGKVSVAKARLGPGDKLFKPLDDIEEVALRAKSIAGRLRASSMGEGALLRKPVSIEGLLRDTAELVLNGTGVEYGCSVDDALLDVSIDEEQVGAAMNNIILNALQASGEGGVVKIGAGNVVVSGSDALPLKDGPYVRITVKDSGAGIPDRDLPRIFEPFYTTKEKASGLGLALAYSVIKKHGGHIDVEPADDGGMLFSVYLPSGRRE
jgi:signal transduction histidine kinase